MDVKDAKKDFSVLVGVDELILPALIIGCDGGIPALANIAPKLYVNLHNAWIEKRFNDALEYYAKF